MGSLEEETIFVKWVRALFAFVIKVYLQKIENLIKVRKNNLIKLGIFITIK